MNPKSEERPTGEKQHVAGGSQLFTEVRDSAGCVELELTPGSLAIRPPLPPDRQLISLCFQRYNAYEENLCMSVCVHMYLSLNVSFYHFTV